MYLYMRALFDEALALMLGNIVLPVKAEVVVLIDLWQKCYRRGKYSTSSSDLQSATAVNFVSLSS